MSPAHSQTVPSALRSEFLFRDFFKGPPISGGPLLWGLIKEGKKLTLLLGSRYFQGVVTFRFVWYVV